MATVPEECTNEEQHSVMLLFLGSPMNKIFIKKCFLCMLGSVCHVKRFTSGKRFTDDEEVETEMGKWLRQ
jgi:hypothetical protein